MQVPPIFEQAESPSAPGYLQYLSRVLIRMWGQMALVVNSGIELYKLQNNGVAIQGNVRGYLWRGNLTNQPVVIQHNLGYIPAGFVTLRITSSTVPYFVSATNTTITVDCNGNAPDTILLIS